MKITDVYKVVTPIKWYHLVVVDPMENMLYLQQAVFKSNSSTVSSLSNYPIKKNANKKLWHIDRVIGLQPFILELVG